MCLIRKHGGLKYQLLFSKLYVSMPERDKAIYNPKLSVVNFVTTYEILHQGIKKKILKYLRCVVGDLGVKNSICVRLAE